MPVNPMSPFVANPAPSAPNYFAIEEARFEEYKKDLLKTIVSARIQASPDMGNDEIVDSSIELAEKITDVLKITKKLKEQSKEQREQAIGQWKQNIDQALRQVGPNAMDRGGPMTFVEAAIRASASDLWTKEMKAPEEKSYPTIPLLFKAE